MIEHIGQPSQAARGISRTVSRLVWIPIRTLIVVLTLGVGGLAWANPGISDLCENAARLASQKTGVPLAVLRAITLSETGRKTDGAFRPWPWTVNMEGKGDWFDTREQAQAYADQNFRRGARSFDVGCFQLNYKWHGNAFASLEEMFEPSANAIYAANFLRELYAEKGNWVDAAGAYHSRTPTFANRYKKRFARIYAQLSDDPLPLPSPLNPKPADQPDISAGTVDTIIARLNGFPLLQTGTGGMASLGSLMPASAGIGAQRLIGGG